MKILVGGALALVSALIVTWFALINNPPGTCTSTVSSISDAVTALEGAGMGEVICLTDGTYGTMTLDGARSTEVTLRAEHPGAAHIGTVTINKPASHYRLSEMEIAGITIVGDSDASPNHITIDRNLIQNGGFGVDAVSPTYPVPGGCCTTGNTVPITDLSIYGNIFGAVTVEDALRLDGITRAQVVHNEFTGVIPPNPDAHTDCIQTVWGDHDVLIANNYFHDNACQAIFIGKDGDVVNLTIKQNLIVRNRALGPTYEPSSWTLGHHALIRNNTWVGYGTSARTTDLILFNDPANHANGNPASADAVDVVADHNVFSALFLNDYSATPSPSTGIFADPSVLTEDHNVIGWATWTGDRPLGRCSVIQDTPAFVDPATDDYRLTVTGLADCGTWNAGVTWRPADQDYGPGS